MRKAQERSLEIFQKKVKMGRKYCPLPIEPKTLLKDHCRKEMGAQILKYFNVFSTKMAKYFSSF